MSEECIFCKIARKEMPTQPIYEDHDLIAFADIHPVAPVHVLIVPKEHMVNLNELEARARPESNPFADLIPATTNSQPRNTGRTLGDIFDDLPMATNAVAATPQKSVKDLTDEELLRLTEPSPRAEAAAPPRTLPRTLSALDEASPLRAASPKPLTKPRVATLDSWSYQASQEPEPNPTPQFDSYPHEPVIEKPTRDNSQELMKLYE